MSSLLRTISSWLPKGYPDAFRQILLFVTADLLYETVRGLAEGRKSVAFANGQTIIDLERSLGTYFEPAFQSFFISSQTVVDVANFLYMNSHFVLTTVFMIWLYIWRNDSFYFVRNMFMAAMALALVGYTLLPTAPFQLRSSTSNPPRIRAATSCATTPCRGWWRMGSRPSVTTAATSTTTRTWCTSACCSTSRRGCAG